MSEENTNPTPFAEIEMGPSKFEEFMDQHQKKLLGLAILILFGVLAIVAQQTLQKQKREDAGSATLTANDVSSYQEVISNFPNSASASTAELLLATAEADENPAKAIEALKNFVSTNDEHPALPSALTILGQYQLEAGEIEQAKATLKEVTLLGDNANHIKHIAYISLGDIESQQGNIEAASSNYEQAKTFDTSKILAEFKLTTLGVDPPELIEPAPAELPTPPQPTAPTPTAPTPTLPNVPLPVPQTAPLPTE